MQETGAGTLASASVVAVVGPVVLARFASHQHSNGWRGRDDLSGSETGTVTALPDVPPGDQPLLHTTINFIRQHAANRLPSGTGQTNPMDAEALWGGVALQQCRKELPDSDRGSHALLKAMGSRSCGRA